MKLIYKGVELDSTTEHELFCTNEKLGFDVEINFSETFCKERKVERVVKYHNVTEVHNKFKSFDSDGDKIAFESDIHCTGGWRYIKDIEQVIITDATEVAEDYN